MKTIEEIIDNITLHSKSFNIPFYDYSNGETVLMDPVIDSFDIDIEDPSNVVIITSHDVDGEKKYQDWLWNAKENRFEMITKYSQTFQRSPRTTWKEKCINMECPKKLTKNSMIDMLKMTLILKNESHD